MVEIGGMPILWHIMKIYSAHGVNDFVICLGYKGYVIKEFFANYFLHTADVTLDLAKNSMEVHRGRSEPWRVTLVDTGANSQTGGRLKAVREYIHPDEPFCFTYGDGLADVDVTAEIAFHRKHGRKATIMAVAPPGRFGALEFEGDAVRASRRSRPATAADQRRFFRARPVGARPYSTASTPLGGRAARDAGQHRRAGRVPPRRFLATDGYAARPQITSKSCGSGSRRGSAGESPAPGPASASSSPATPGSRAVG